MEIKEAAFPLDSDRHYLARLNNGEWVTCRVAGNTMIFIAVYGEYGDVSLNEIDHLYLLPVGDEEGGDDE